MTLVLFMLCSGFVHFTFASHRLRLFNYNGIVKNGWWDSLKECNLINQSLVTLYDDEDAEYLKKFREDRLHLTSAWLGLSRRRKNITTWSDGVPVTHNVSSVTLTNGEQKCGAIQNNTLTSFNCSDRNAFMCHKDGNYHLIENVRKNWCQAQQYCRRYFHDLVSIREQTQNQQVLVKGMNKTFWIGLMHDEWEWTDKSCSTFRSWAKDPSQNCTIQSSHFSTSMLMSGCDNQHNSLCSQGHVRIIVIRENLTWEQALDYCEANHTGLLRIEDANDQRAVHQRLNYTDGGGPFWIGLRQSRVFGFWIWSDRTVTYSNWKNGKQPEMPLSNNCGAIYTTDHTWGDVNCSHQLPFICEEEISFMKTKIVT
ncbi:secretory phospholipase A2 receptor [Scophthalmus maximus]|uniref:C-type lectin domain-containing protein n=1 Tax=Scophthalmus maximus TaxID=52904 RepID=A0A8D2ZCR8_SCOMX|nr:secretory phospholipase A2 receptor [Scophthalmus maximus]